MDINHKFQATLAATVGKYEIAQYHATRLLAEQQRIANLIALYRSESNFLSSAAFDALAQSVPVEPFSNDPEFVMLQDIREGLGLA